jgi:hypothetical protein
VSAGCPVVQIEIRTEELRFPPQHHPPAPGASPQVPGASFIHPPGNYPEAGSLWFRFLALRARSATFPLSVNLPPEMRSERRL